MHEKVRELDRQIHAWHRSNEQSLRLETIPGIGPITASAIVATVTDTSLFKSGRQLAAWLGLVPRQNSSGGKDRLVPDQLAGRSLYPSTACRWRTCGPQIQPQEQSSAYPLGCRASDEKAL